MLGGFEHVAQGIQVFARTMFADRSQRNARGRLERQREVAPRLLPVKVTMTTLTPSERATLPTARRAKHCEFHPSRASVSPDAGPPSISPKPNSERQDGLGVTLTIFLPEDYNSIVFAKNDVL